MEFGVLDYLYPRKFRDMRVFIVILFISMYFFSFFPPFYLLKFLFWLFFLFCLIFLCVCDVCGFKYWVLMYSMCQIVRTKTTNVIQ